MSETVYLISESRSLVRRMGVALKSSRLVFRHFGSIRAFLVGASGPLSGCVVLEGNRSAGAGLSGIGRLRRKDVVLPIIVLAVEPTVCLAVEACKAGAADFLDTALPDEALVARIRVVVETASHEVRSGLVNGRARAKLHGLAPRELQVLGLLADGATPAKIAEVLGISIRTVEGHCATIRRRTGAKTHAQLVRLALEAER